LNAPRSPQDSRIAKHIRRLEPILRLAAGSQRRVAMAACGTFRVRKSLSHSPIGPNHEENPMIRKSLLVSALAFASTGAFAAPQTYQIDPSHTNVLFTWSHFGFSHPTGNFKDVGGTIVFDQENPTASKVDVTIPLSSLDTDVDDLDTHLRKADFFDAEKYPTITFKSTKIEKGAGDNRFSVTGDLTLHGVTRPIVLDATLNKVGEMMGTRKIGFDATASVKRSDFGMGAYVPNISDEIPLRITTEAFIPEEKEKEAAE
jgi:polyisoprenoid-binding protein YceI